MAISTFPVAAAGGGGGQLVVYKGNPGSNATTIEAGFYLVEDTQVDAFPITIGDQTIGSATNSFELDTSASSIDFQEVFIVTEHSVPAGFNSTRRETVFGDGKFVHVGRTPYVATSTDGVTWTEQTVPNFSEFVMTGIAFGDSTFVITGRGGYIATSPDGVTWTERSSGTTDDINDVAYGDGIFFAVGDNERILTSSNDGATWTPASVSASGTNFEYAAYGNGVYFAGGNSRFARSTDASTWTEETIPDLGGFSLQPTFGNGAWLVQDSNENFAISTDNAVTWSSVTIPNYTPTTQSLNKFANGLFFVGDDGQLFLSENGTTWTEQTFPNSGSRDLEAAAFGNGVYSLIAHDFFPYTSTGFNTGPQFIVLQPTQLIDLT